MILHRPKLLNTAIAAACLVAVAGAVAAQPMMEGWHHGGDEMAFLHGLNLTEAQKHQAHAILHAAFANGRPLMEQMHTLHEQHVTLLLTAGSTRDQLAAVLHQEESVRNEIDTRRLDVALQLRALLTPAQLARAADQHSKLEALHAQERQVLESEHDMPE